MTRAAVMTMEEEEIAFYFCMGKAVSEWGIVENVLRSLLLDCFESKGGDDITHNVLSVGFFSIETFKAKMDFIEGIVLRRFPDNENEWADLVTRARKASGHRNKLAHWAVQIYEQNNPGRRYLLTPWVFQKSKKKSKKPQPPAGYQALRDVQKMRLEFVSLSMALRNFGARLHGLKEPFAKSLEQPENPPPIGTLRGQILEGLARLLKSSEKKS